MAALHWQRAARKGKEALTQTRELGKSGLTVSAVALVVQVTISPAQRGLVCTTEVPETPIPTMTGLGVALFVALIGLGAFTVLRRRHLVREGDVR